MCYCIYFCCFFCFSKASAKTLEIILIVFHSIGIILLLCCLILIKWHTIPFSKVNLFLFILMELICIACLVFSFLLRLWRAKNIIKSGKTKILAITISLIGYILITSFFAILFVEDIFAVYRINKDSEESFFTYFSLIVLELISILGIDLWANVKCRVNLGLDGPLPQRLESES